MKQTIRKIIGGLMLTSIFWLAIAGCKKDQASPDTNSIPEILKVPGGHKLVLDAYAKGVQIYQVQRSTNDPYIFSWVNIAPSATLFSKPDYTDTVAIHFAGPSWKLTKGPNTGDTVVGKKLQGITRDPKAIQWLLLQADGAHSSTNNKVTYIQRLFTAGGLAPTTGADEAHLGRLDSIPYTARYFFYEAGQ